jgi:hypothetical protein
MHACTYKRTHVLCASCKIPSTPNNKNYLPLKLVILPWGNYLLLSTLYHTYRIKKFSKFWEVVPPTCMHHLKIKVKHNIIYEIRTKNTNFFIRHPLVYIRSDLCKLNLTCTFSQTILVWFLFLEWHIFHWLIYLYHSYFYGSNRTTFCLIRH